MMDLAKIPRWQLVTPLCVAVVLGGTVFRVCRNKSYIRTFIRHSHDDVCRVGERATEEYAADYIKESMVATKEERNVKRVAYILTLLVNDNNELAQFFHDDDPGSWRISVINEDICKAISFPNGYIFVHKGLLDTVSSDDELAFLLAHELAVIYLKQTENQLNSPITVWKVLAFILAPISFSFYSEPMSTAFARLLHAIEPQDFITAYGVINADLQLVSTADKKACDYIIKSCYDPRAVTTILLKLSYQETLSLFAQTNSRQIPAYYSTNPIIKNMLIPIPEERTARGWTSKDRLDMLDDHLTMTSALRHKVFSCPPLPIADPRKKTTTMERLLNRYMNRPSGSQTIKAQKKWSKASAASSKKREDRKDRKDSSVSAHSAHSAQSDVSAKSGQSGVSSQSVSQSVASEKSASPPGSVKLKKIKSLAKTLTKTPE